MSATTDTRSRILTAAERLFRVHGYQKTTVADIARELQMSPANVYRFFRSKQDLVEAVAALLLGAVEAAAAAIATQQQEPAASRLRQIVAEMSRLNVRRYADERMLHDVCAAAMTDGWPLVEAHRRDIAGAIERIIADGIASGEFRNADAGVLAHCVQRAITALCHPALIAEIGVERTASAVLPMTDFVLAALRV